MAFKTLDSIELSGKRVFCRLDLNCPTENGAPQRSQRIAAHALTAYDLSRKGAKTVLLAHQGRKGDEDCISLAQHAKLLEEEISKIAKPAASAPKVQFVDDVCGEKAISAIKALKPGELLLLENVRFLDDETKFDKTGKSQLVDALSPLCEVFVLDAFSCAHRGHASVIGFSKVPCLAGRVMQQELEALGAFRKPKRPVAFILGGAKPDDSLPILKNWLDEGKLDYALCGGTLGNLMLIASGQEIGKSLDFLKEKGAIEHLPVAKELYAKYKKRIFVPSDVVVDENGKPKVLESSKLPSQYSILDIGPKTAAHFADIIEHAGSIVMNGPMGVYEKDEFSKGTKIVLDAIASSKGFSLLGGGHTLSALDKFKINRRKLGYVSLSGKALIEYLSGEKLPGVELLENSK
jgi:phosphoglycerate kinase